MLSPPLSSVGYGQSSGYACLHILGATEHPRTRTGPGRGRGRGRSRPRGAGSGMTAHSFGSGTGPGPGSDQEAAEQTVSVMSRVTV